MMGAAESLTVLPARRTGFCRRWLHRVVDGVRALGTALALLPLIGIAGLQPALASGINPAYAAVVIEPTRTPDRAEFDLTAVVKRAQREKKSLYLYLGASDCPFCRRYEAFLDKNAAELAPQFDKYRYLVVDLRSALSVNGKLLYIRVGDRSLPYAEFQQSIGDERARQLVYPSVWLLDASGAQLKPLMQMPAGTGTFQTVSEQLEILRLEQ